MPPLQVALSLAGMVIIIVGAYYVTYFIGVKSSGLSRGRNRNINMVDRFAMSRDKSFCIVEIAGKVYIIGVTNHTMTLIDTLGSEEFAKSAERGEPGAWPRTPGGPIGVMRKGLKSFFANMTGKQNQSFESSMRIAREKASELQEGPEGIDE